MKVDWRVWVGLVALIVVGVTMQLVDRWTRASADGKPIIAIALVVVWCAAIGALVAVRSGRAR